MKILPLNRSHLSPAAFIDPTASDNSAAEEFARVAIERVLDLARRAGERPPLPDNAEDGVPATAVPEQGRPEALLLDDLERVLACSMNPAHPGWIGHMDPTPATASAVADFATALSNNNMLSAEMSPVLTRLERALVREMTDLFGLGENAGGLMLSGGTLANLQALVVARNAAFDVAKDGLAALGERPVLFASEVAHTSLQKAAVVLGLGRTAVQPVAVDAASRMRPEALSNAMDEAERRGERPFCVVATAGTTTTGSVDPLPEIGDLCRNRELWFHVDAAYGGAAMYSEQYKSLLRGVELADSVTFDPQKWLYVAKTCALLLFRNEAIWQRHFHTGAPYMKQENGLVNLGEVGLQGSRHADALKLWATLQHLGRRGIAQLVDESVRLARRLADLIRDRPYLRLANAPEMNVVCFRGEPEWVEKAAWDRWNADLQAHLLKEHKTFFSLPTYRGERWLRAVVLNPFTDESDLREALSQTDRYVELNRRSV